MQKNKALKLVDSIRISNIHFNLSEYKTRISKDIRKRNFTDEDSDLEEISKLQNKLYAEDRQSLLIIFQGMDSAGKDGAIKHILKVFNPQGVAVTSFKHPSELELEHDYLWRHAIKLPGRGQIAIFNRSHYENVLISKVHPELVLFERLLKYNTLAKLDNEFWELRYRQINLFEERIIESGTHILKLFLHLSKNEQCERFLERIKNENKNWKFSEADIKERKYWLEYQDAYQDLVRKTSTKSAPWFVVPADDKSTARSIICKIILDKLMQMNPKFPVKSVEETHYMKNIKSELEGELGI